MATINYVPLIALAFSAVAPPPPVIMGLGNIDGYVPPETFTPAGAMVGTLSASAVYVGGTYYGATAYQDLGTTGNTSSVTFNYQGSEAAGGATVGVRWNDSAQQGIFAFIDSSGPTLRIFEMSSGWVYVQDNSTSLTLTAGNGYTLTLADNGSVVTATITDDTAVQTCSITTSLNTGNTETLFGWVGTTASYIFNAAIVGMTTSQTGTVATPDISPAAGTYTYAQSVYLSSTPGASIYYTTDGSTPTSGSTPYTGPISVTAAETIKAIGILAGWTDSAVASAAYTIIGWTMEAGSIDGNTSGTFALTGSDYGTLSASVFYAGTWKAATAYYDLGTSGNGVSVTFTYQGPEGGGGAAAGLRWDDSAQEGDFAFIDTSSTPVIRLYETTAGWSSGTSATSSSLTLTSGNSYSLTIFDNGTTVTAMLTDDVGPQSCTITPTLSTSNTQAMFGWIGLAGNYTFNATITNVSAEQWTTVATPTFSPAGGTYTSTQTVTISTYTSGATIYYTTDGSTPTTSSTVYTGQISVSTSQTVNAIAAYSGWTNSDVGSASYAIACATPTFSPAAGTYTSAQTVTITSTSGSTIYYTVDGTPPTGSGATVSFTASGGAITSVTTTPTSGGSGYPASATFNLDVAGGTGGVVSATTNSSGLVTSFSATPVAGGSGYSSSTWETTSANVSTISSGGSITVSTSQTVNAIASLTGYGNSAEGSAAYTISSGPTQSLYLNGSGQYGYVSDATVLKPAELTACGWFKVYPAGFQQMLFCKSSSWQIFYQGGVMYGSVSGNYSAAYTWSPDSDWHHWAITFDGTNVKLYLDGTQVATGTSTISYDSNPIGIGALVTGSYAYPAEDHSCDLRLYDDVETISTIYNGGTPSFSDSTVTGGHLVGWWQLQGDATDSSGNGNNGTLVNSPAFGSDVP